MAQKSWGGGGGGLSFEKQISGLFLLFNLDFNIFSLKLKWWLTGFLTCLSDNVECQSSKPIHRFNNYKSDIISIITLVQYTEAGNHISCEKKSSRCMQTSMFQWNLTTLLQSLFLILCKCAVVKDNSCVNQQSAYLSTKVTCDFVPDNL